MTNAIHAMMDEAQTETTTNDSESSDTSGNVPAPSPITGGYLAVTDTVHLLEDIGLALAEQAGYDDIDSPSDLLGSFNPNDFVGETLGESKLDVAAKTAMEEAPFDTPKPIAGLLGATKVVKKLWGGQHPERVSKKGHHGVGLDTSGTYAMTRDGSYGDHYPNLPAFDEVVGVETLDGGERSTLEDTFGIPVSDIGVNGPVKILAPNGERLPIAYAGDDALASLADDVSRLTAMPTLFGPDNYEGEVTTADSSHATNDEDLPLDAVPFDPRDLNVNECRSRISGVGSQDVITKLGQIEEAHPSYTDTIEVDGERFHGGRKGVHKRLMERANALEDHTSGDGNADGNAVETMADGSDESNESDGSGVEDVVLTLLEHDADCATIEDAREKAEANGLL